MNRSPSTPKFIPAGSFRSAIGRVAAGIVLAAGILPVCGMSAAPAPAPVVALAPPEPEAIPRRWQLEIEPGSLRLATVELPGGAKKAFYYLTYRVINNSGEDLLFAPSFELTSEYGNRRSGTEVPTEVTRALIAQTQNTYIEDQISIIGQLLQGKENAKDGIVIWPANDLDVDSLVIYAAGFSGETTSVDMPATKDKVVLRKTFQMNYQVAGDMSQMIGKEIARSESPRWIMR